MARSRWMCAAVVALVVVAGAVPVVARAKPGPQIDYAVEGRAPTSSRPVVTVWGRSLTAVRRAELILESSGAIETDVVLISKNAQSLTVGLPADVPSGTHQLVMYSKSGLYASASIAIGNGAPLPGAVSAGSIAPELREDLDDADTLDGRDSTYFATQADLSAHTHDALYATLGHNHDAAYAALGHNHDSTYAALGHNHDATYAKKAFIGAKVYLTAVHAPGSITPIAAIPFDAEEFDTDNCHSGTSNPSRLTCNTAGFYRIVARAYFVSNNSVVLLVIRKNNAPITRARVPYAAAADASAEISTIVYLAVGDYVEFAVTPDVGFGGGSTLKEGPGYTELLMSREGD